MTALVRLAPRAKRTALAVVALLALLLIGAVITELTIAGSRDGGFRQDKPALRPSPREITARAATTRAATTRAATMREATTRSTPHRLAPPVRSAQLMRARDAAERFLGTFLAFAYGRARALEVRGVTAGLGRQLRRGRAAITPVEHSRRPRVARLGVVGMTPGFALATAVVNDGGITVYRLRFTLQARAGRWLVNGVQQG